MGWLLCCWAAQIDGCVSITNIFLFARQELCILWLFPAGVVSWKWNGCAKCWILRIGGNPDIFIEPILYEKDKVEVSRMYDA